MSERKKKPVRGKTRAHMKSALESERHREAMEGLKMTFSEDTFLFSPTSLTLPQLVQKQVTRLRSCECWDVGLLAQCSRGSPH